MLTALVRLPFFPSLLDAGRTDLFAGPAWLPEFLLVTNAFAVPAVVGFIIAAVVQQQLRLYRHRSEHDGLTELLTRSAFATALREEQPGFGAIVLADIDFFKKVNDRHGHGVGDDVIRHFAALLGSAAPVAGRFGGEEFAIALPGHSIARAAELAERLRGEFATYRHEAFAPDERLSASFGVAPYYRRRPLEASLVEADRALYRAKGLGRDMVCLYGTNEFERPDTRQSA
nr:GGDEF domain-containing protein [Sphingomicrobium astaxanthinifaciens]